MRPPPPRSKRISDRLWSGGITGLIGGAERRRSKLIGTPGAFLLFFALRPVTGFLVALIAVAIYSTVAGLVLRLRKHRAGVPLDSLDY